MDIQRGHIFSRGIIKGQVNYGKWQVAVEIDSKTVIFILEDKYVPPDIRIKRDTPVSNVVVIEYKDEKFHVALYKYWDKLIKYYYHNSYLKKTRWNFWYNRWKDECTERFISNFTVKEIKTNYNPPLLCFFGLNGKGYVLPILGYKDLSCLKGTPLFFPDTFIEPKDVDKEDNLGKLATVRQSNTLKAPRNVYKTDNFDNVLLTYKVKMIGWGKGKESKDVNVFLHGFTSPAKWHFNVWKHLLGFVDNAKREEADDWYKLLGKEFYTKRINKDLFKDCKPNTKNTSCDEDHCIKSSLFRQIHPQIEHYCKGYFKNIVTLFEADSTNTLKIFEEPDGNWKLISLIYIKEITNSKKQILSLEGISHNFDDNTPVLHLIPITMFIPDSPKYIPEPKDKFDDSKLIFYGSLKEITKC